MCEHTWLVTNYSNICSSCGLERGVLKLDTWNKYAAPLTRNYDRKSRFSVKVDKREPMKKIGTRSQVWSRKAERTSGGLRRSDIMKNKAGKLVSKKKSINATRNSNLGRHKIRSKTQRSRRNYGVDSF